MSSQNQGHSKGSPKEDTKASPTKWRSPNSSPANASPTHHPHPHPAGGQSQGQGQGSSSQQQQPRSNSPGRFFSSLPKSGLNFKKLMKAPPFGKEDQQQHPAPPTATSVPARSASPELLVDIDHSSPAAVAAMAGAIVDPLLGNGIPLLQQNGGGSNPLPHQQHHHPHHNNHHPHGHDGNGSGGGGISDHSGTENYSDDRDDSGSSYGGDGAHDSGGNSNQSPTTDSCAAQTNISALPENVLENIFSFLELSDVRNASLVCHEWNRIVADENNEVWRTQCFRRMTRDVVHSELLLTCPTFKAKLRAHIHAWNPLDCSRNIIVKPNFFTIHRNPVAQSTDGARGKIGFNRGRHAWEVVWEGPLGTVAVVGVATQQAEMRAQGYIALLGKDDQSWGWNLVENLLLHNGDSQGNYPVINNAPRYQVGERIRVILDCEDNTLSFEKNFEFLGVAFRGLPNRERLYPAVSAVYGNTEISMVYLGPPLDG